MTWFLCGIAAILAGLGLIEVSLTPGSGVGQIIGTMLCGLILLAGGAAMLFLGLPELREKFRSLRRRGRSKTQATPDPAAEKFRKDLREFYHLTGRAENTNLQSDVTPFLWHTLELERNRLQEKGLSLDFSSECTETGRRSTRSDGKYRITELREGIAASGCYRRNGKKLLTRSYRQDAVYTLLGTERTPEGRILCPSCGSPATRENLIDGCDFCGTKFRVEDLGEKVSSFTLRSDYEREYAAYKRARKRAGILIASAAAAAVFLLCLIYSACGGLGDVDAGPVLTFVAAVFASAVCAALAGAVAGGLYAVLLFPVLQVGAAACYLTRRELERLRAQQFDDRAAEETIRRVDPLFSMEDFYANVRNKLQAVHFASDAREVNAFAEADLSGVLKDYADTAAAEVREIALKSYSADAETQTARVSAALGLLLLRGGRLVSRRERLLLVLQKSAACKTETVCTPSVLRCRGCGSSLSLMDGKLCPYCGRTLELRQHDWVITGYSRLP